MKRKIFPLILIVLVLSLFVFRETLLYKIGTFLVVDQSADKVDVAVTTAFGEKVAQRYRDGKCAKILFLIGNIGQTWKGNATANFEEDIIAQARQYGIKTEDLVFFNRPQDDIELYKSMENLLLQKDLHSAVFYVGFYRSRRYRFYLDRYFNPRTIVTYVQPINPNNDYMLNFERWWENTLWDNLFMDEYLKMAFYYFNKLLWNL